MRRAEFLLVGLVLIAALGLRLVALHADPPAWLSWSAGLFSDEGIYSEDSRLLVLYGQHMQGDFRIAAIAPLHYHLLVWVFRHSSTISLATARIVAVFFSTAALLCFWATLRLTHGARTALLGALLLSFSAPFVLYNRMGLLEMPALFWLAAAFLASACAALSIAPGMPAPRHVRALACLAAAGALCGVAVAWKATFLLGALALLIHAAVRYRHRAWAAAGGFLVTLAAYYAAFVRPNRGETLRAGRYYFAHQYLPHTAHGLWHNVVRATVTGAGDGVLVYLAHFAPVLLILAVSTALAPRLRSSHDAWLWLWLLVPLTAMIVSSYAPSRYFVQFWPALAGLAACAVSRLPSRSLTVAATAAILAFDAALLGHSYLHRAYTVQTDARTLELTLPRDSWIAGQFAPTLCMECSLRSFYVQKGLANDSPDTLRLLPITHVLATRTASSSQDPWRGDYSQLVAAPAGLRALTVGKNYRVDLYANLNALP